MCEALLVIILGGALAFAANKISPRGLSLTHNYFPGGTNNTVRPANTPNLPGTNSTAPTPADLVIQQIKARGFQTVDGDQALQLFHDPRREQELVVFVDARNEAHYHEGHIPGAYEFDPYQPEKYFAVTVPVCQKAEQVVVYCNGGDCDDSLSAAIYIRDGGVANEKLFVYTGGTTEWNAKKLPMETGDRNSGTLRDTPK